MFSRQIPVLIATASSAMLLFLWNEHPYLWTWIGFDDNLNLPLLGWLIAYVFAQPLSRAYMSGLLSARDPAVRLTPSSSWVHFFHSFWPLIRPCLWLWLVFALVINGTLYTFSKNFMFISRTESILIMNTMILQACCWVTLAGFIIAPYCRRAGLLKAILVATYPLIACGTLELADELDVNTGFVIATLYGGTGLAMLVGLAGWAWYVMRRGEWWFRFEE